MKTSTDPGSKKKAIPQSKRAWVVTPRSGRTCSWWRREGTGQGVVGLEREKNPSGIAGGGWNPLTGKSMRKTGWGRHRPERTPETGRSMGLRRRSSVGQPRPLRGGRVGGRNSGTLGVYRKRIRWSIGGIQGPEWHITGAKEAGAERKELRRGQMGLTWAGEVLGHQ